MAYFGRRMIKHPYWFVVALVTGTSGVGWIVFDSSGHEVERRSTR